MDNNNLGYTLNQHCEMNALSAQGCLLTPQSIQKPELFSHGKQKFMCLYAI